MSAIEKARASLAANPFPPNPFVEVVGDVIVIRSGFSEQLLALLRWAPNVQWRPEKRHWTVSLAGANAVRAALPEILRLAELTQPKLAEGVAAEADLLPPELFRRAARLAFGGDWQRDAARALDRDEAALAGWLAGDRDLEDAPALLSDMLAVLRRRSDAIAAEADRLAAALDRQDR